MNKLYQTKYFIIDVWSGIVDGWVSIWYCYEYWKWLIRYPYYPYTRHLKFFFNSLSWWHYNEQFLR